MSVSEIEKSCKALEKASRENERKKVVLEIIAKMEESTDWYLRLAAKWVRLHFTK